MQSSPAPDGVVHDGHQFLNDVKPPVLEKPFTASTLEGLLKRAQSR